MQQMVLYQLIYGVDTFLNILSVILVVYALMTWFMRPDSPVYIFFARIADVAISPFRPIANWLIHIGLRIDLSVFLALAGIQILRNLLTRLMYMVF